MRRPIRYRLLALGLCVSGLVGVAASCGDASPSRSGGAATPPAPDQSTQPTASAALEDDIAKAIHVRADYGLRADEAWVRAVSEDPVALVPEQWGIPLLPDELADLMSRRWPHDLLLQVRSYGLQFPDDFATAYQNLKASGVVINFKANVEQHRAALAALPLIGPVQVGEAEWSIKDLEGFLKAVKAEEAWLESIGARFVAPTLRPIDNVVLLRYEGAKGLENVIEEHFGNPTWLRVRWDGPFRG